MAHTKKMIAVVAVVEVGAVDKVASNKKSLFLKIAIVVAIVVVIVGIFIFKSAKNNDQTAQENTASQSQTEEDAVNYPLKITKLTLNQLKHMEYLLSLILGLILVFHVNKCHLFWKP